jgi:hypothetical protein
LVDKAASVCANDEDAEKALVVRAGANDETRLDARAKKKVIVAGRWRITIMMMPRKRDIGVVERSDNTAIEDGETELRRSKDASLLMDLGRHVWAQKYRLRAKANPNPEI